MNQSQQQNKIAMEYQKSSQWITPKNGKQKSIQSSESPISSSSPQITAFAEKKQLHISKVFETYTIQDSPSVHEMKQTQHLNKITTEQQKSSQMITPNKEKQKLPLQLSQTSKSPITSASPQVVTAFPEEKQSRFPQISEILSEQQNFHPEGHDVTPINDSGIAAENSLSVIETDEETELRSEISGVQTVGKSKKNADPQKYKKLQRICKFCNKLQTRLKRDILTKYSKEPTVEPLLKMNSKYQDRKISKLRKEAIIKFNIDLLEKGESDFMRERKSGKAGGDIPVMCSGCCFFFFPKATRPAINLFVLCQELILCCH